MLRRIFVAVSISLLAFLSAASVAQAAEFGFQPGSLYANLTGPDAGQAGAAADLEFGFKMTTVGSSDPQEMAGTIKDFYLDLPEGMIGNPTPFDECPISKVNLSFSTCPATSAIGMVQVALANPGSGATDPPGMSAASRIFRVPTQGDEAAAFAFNASNAFIVRMGATADPERGYRIRTSALRILETAPMYETQITLWGIPAEHQAPGSLGLFFDFGNPLPPSEPRHRFLSVPTRCEGNPLQIDFTMDPWSTLYTRYQTTADLPLPSGCDQLEFEPSMTVTPEHRRAGQPTGYEVVVEVPQNEDAVDGLETPNLKDAVVTLPEGVSISPPQAAGLEACSDAQFGIDKNTVPGCPGASKVGEVLIETPVLDDPVPGNIFVGEQLSSDPLSGDMVRIFVTGRAPGVRLKLLGRVSVDPVSGQLTARFDENPELPFSRFTLTFKGGDTAPLVNPSVCGTHTTTAKFMPWGGPTADITADFTIDQNCDGPAKFEPSFTAGSADPTAGASSSFSVLINRTEADEEIRSLREVRLPEGLLGDLSSVELCPSAAADRGECPAASKVGRVEISSGAGEKPLWVPQAGKKPTAVYLTEGYRGGRFGLSVVVPAQAGPFDLGWVVDRLSLHLDERTTQLTVREEQSRVYNADGTLKQVNEGAMPRILDGVFLNVRDIRVHMDKPGFMRNPTDCSQMQVGADILSFGGKTAQVSNRFRAADCALLGFAPKLTARILDKGRKSTLRSFHPRTRFVVTPNQGDANIAGARVVLPSSTLLDQANIGTTCTRAQMAARNCPANSIVGYATAWSPLLKKPVQGPVYLAANGGVRPLPDLAAVLDGEIRVVLQGEISTLRTRGKARLQNTFRVVPDAPVSRFVITIQGGKKTGLLVNSTDLCRTKERGVAVFHGQNGKRHRSNPRIATTFKGCGKVRRQAARRAARR